MKAAPKAYGASIVSKPRAARRHLRLAPEDSGETRGRWWPEPPHASQHQRSGEWPESAPEALGPTCRPRRHRAGPCTTMTLERDDASERSISFAVIGEGLHIKREDCAHHQPQRRRDDRAIAPRPANTLSPYRIGIVFRWPGRSHVRVFARHRRVRGVTLTRLPETRRGAGVSVATSL